MAHTVKDVMTGHPVTVRRMPAVEGGRPGILSVGDLAMRRDEESVLADISAAPANQ